MPRKCSCGVVLKNRSKATKQCRSCYIANVLSKRTGSNHFHWRGGRPKCLDCGKQLASYYSKRCKHCAGKLRMGENNVMKKLENKQKLHEVFYGKERPDLSGRNHHNWKGGITPEDRLNRVKFQRTIQKKVFERDDYTCQICRKRGGNLQVDHIQPWAEYVGGRFDINNCRTLCMACHYKITFGREIPEGVIWGHNLTKIGG